MHLASFVFTFHYEKSLPNRMFPVSSEKGKNDCPKEKSKVNKANFCSNFNLSPYKLKQSKLPRTKNIEFLIPSDIFLSNVHLDGKLTMVVNFTWEVS